MENCVFCDWLKNNAQKIIENDLAIAYYDQFPVSIGHALVITKRHVATFFDTTEEERIAIFDLVDKIKQINDKNNNPDGYNIGINCGKYAGQSVMHIHVHVIPRYKGDVENPRGGIRGVIPNKKDYKED